MTLPVGRPLALPPELEPVRDAARRVILPIKPVTSATEAEKNFLFTATRTNAGRRLPPYYLVYFLFVDLLGFPNLGRSEKLAWSVPIDFCGVAYLIEHRKFGVGVFAREGDEWEQQSARIVALIHRGIRTAKPLFKWMAEEAVRSSKLNIRNMGRKLFQQYVFFRDAFWAAASEIKLLKLEHEAERRQGRLTLWRKSRYGGFFSAESYAIPWAKTAEDANWLALGAIDAFFAWTEHIFIHMAVLQAKVTTGQQVADLAEADWGTKFKGAFDLGDKVSKGHFDKLVTIRRQLRNYMAHGAFGKEGDAFSFHSGAGAAPIALDHRLTRPQFSLTPELAFDDEEAIAIIQDFVSHHLWADSRAPARLYIQESSLPSILPLASDGTYLAAMASVDDMEEFVDNQSARWDTAANMDW